MVAKGTHLNQFTQCCRSRPGHACQFDPPRFIRCSAILFRYRKMGVINFPPSALDAPRSELVTSVARHFAVRQCVGDFHSTHCSVCIARRTVMDVFVSVIFRVYLHQNCHVADFSQSWWGAT
jgi:hypothetical protein